MFKEIHVKYRILLPTKFRYCSSS